MPLTSRRRRAALAAAPLLAVVLAACSGGSSTGSGPTGAAPTGAAPNLPAVGTKVTGAEFNRQLVAALLKKQTVQVSTVQQDSPTPVTGSLRIAATGTDLALQIPGDAGTPPSEVVAVGGKYYFKGEPVDGKPWVGDGPGSSGNPFARIFSLLGKLIAVTVDPAAQGRSYQQVATFTVTGNRPFGGTTVTDYSGTLTAQQAAAAAGAVSGPESAEIKKNLVESFGGDVTVVLSLAPDGLPLQIATTVTDKGTPVTHTVTYTKWGDPVTITAPDPSQVATA